MESNDASVVVPKATRSSTRNSSAAAAVAATDKPTTEPSKNDVAEVGKKKETNNKAPQATEGKDKRFVINFF